MSSDKFEIVAKLWMNSDTWTLDDAIKLIDQHLPNCFSPPETETDEHEEKGLFVLRELIKNNLNGTLTRYQPIPGEPESTIRINPFEFLDWLEEINPEQIPAALKRARREKEQKRRGTARKERPEKIHQHRVAALAELFWLKEPSLTKVEMSQKAELTDIGCNGKIYKPATIQKWIKESNPNREPGRRT